MSRVAIIETANTEKIEKIKISSKIMKNSNVSEENSDEKLKFKIDIIFEDGFSERTFGF